jgi:hypothetical protein
MASKRELDAMSTDDLLKESQRLMREEDKIKAEKAKVRDAFARAHAREAAVAFLADMTPEQREAVAAVANRKDATVKVERAEISTVAHDSGE